MIELMFALPMFFIIVFLFIWLAVQIQATSGFTSAVNNAVRLGATRGNTVIMGYGEANNGSSSHGLIAPVHSSNFWNTEVIDMLCKDVEFEDCKSYYDTWTNNRFPNKRFQDLPTEAIYAIIYVNEAVRLSNGGSVRFPCSPDGNRQNGDDGSGCMNCEVLPPDALGEISEMKYRLILDCAYQPASYPLGPLTDLLHFIVSEGTDPSQRFIIRRRMFFDRPVFDRDSGN